MSNSIVISIIESMMFPDFGVLYQRKGIEELRVDSVRKAVTLVKKQPADYIVRVFLCLQY